MTDELRALAGIAELAADAAREETLPRFRRVGVELKADGSPVTEADLAAERAIRAVLAERTPDIPVLGEELGGDVGGEGLRWIVDPIDGTIAYSRGLPLYSTLIGLVDGTGESLVGLIDLPALGRSGERYVGWKGGGCFRDGQRVRASQVAADSYRPLISVGDPLCFERCGNRAAYERITREFDVVRGYTDGFGHAQVLHGGVDVMVDLDLKPWDVAASRVLVPEAGGACVEIPHERGTSGLILGSPALVELLSSWIQ